MLLEQFPVVVDNSGTSYLSPCYKVHVGNRLATIENSCLLFSENAFSSPMAIPSAPYSDRPRIERNQFSIRRHLSVENDAEDARHAHVVSTAYIIYTHSIFLMFI